jgi:enoyl-CoA hydratase
MTGEPVRSELREAVAIAHFDDGKANAISRDAIQALEAHLDRAEKEAGAVLICGRPGVLSGGFDLTVARSGPEAVFRLVTAGARLFFRFLEFPLPIVIAATGHAIAAGAVALLAADARVGAKGRFKIGLTEVASGMTLPLFAVELARQRLSKRHFIRATTQAQLYTPEAAVDAGFLDRVTSPEDVFDAARAEADRLAAINQPAFAATKQRAHAALVADLRGSLEADLRHLTGLDA